MNVKAQAMLNAARYVQETYGRDVLEQVLAGCSPAVRDRCTTAIAINWHPLDEFTEFLTSLEKVVLDPQIGEKVGAAGARANTRGVMLRIGLLLSNPESVLRRSATMWRQFNDAGELSLGKTTKTSVEIIITGMPRTPRVFCDTVTGWARELVISAGGKGASASHVECRSRGNARCSWIARWPGGSSE